jgi:hypothetical protein
MTKHLNVHGKWDPRGGLHCFCCPNKTWTLVINTFSTQKNIKNIIDVKKLQPPKVKGVKNSNKKKKTTEHYTQTRNKFLVCCSIAINVERWFVEL